MKWVWIILGSLAAIVALMATSGALLPVSHVAARRARFRQGPAAIWTAISRNGEKTFREDDVNYEVLAAVPERRFVTRIADRNLPYGGTWVYTIDPEPGGSFLEIEERGEVYNPIFRFISRFVMGHTATIDTSLRALAKRFGERIVIEDVRIEDARAEDQPAAR
jgi:hypothetical protein